MVRARSVTTCTFTAAEHASNHCHVGNTRRGGRVIRGWMELTSRGRPESVVML
jgi:hypothetical protein